MDDREELHHWKRGVWKESDEKRLLVLDNYRPHLEADTISLAESMDTDICYVPGGCTGIAQPMYVSNAPFKGASPPPMHIFGAVARGYISETMAAT